MVVVVDIGPCEHGTLYHRGLAKRRQIPGSAQNDPFSPKSGGEYLGSLFPVGLRGTGHLIVSSGPFASFHAFRPPPT